MSRLTLVHYHSGIALQCSNDCVCQNGAWLIPCTDPVCDIPADYLKGNKPPNYPMPAIPLQVRYDYIGCVNIDDVSDVNDPVIVYGWDSWNRVNF